MIEEAEAQIHYASFNSVVKDIGKVDLIYTDPPYEGKDIATSAYWSLASYSYNLLNDGGSLITIVPHYLIDKFFRMMKTSNMKYRWIYCMNQEDGSHPRMAMGIEVMWKPMVHYVRRAFPTGKGFLRDMVKIPEPQKDLHDWQQHEAWVEYYLLKLTEPGDIVLDPFMGSGTVGAVALRNGRRFIGIDNDEEAYETARRRLCLE